jgi:hypothetical protein
LNTDTPGLSRKALIDALLLNLPSVSARKINGLDAYFVNDKMFECISGNGIGLRLPAATATDLQFSRSNVVPFQPAVSQVPGNGYRSTASKAVTTRRICNCFRPRSNCKSGPNPLDRQSRLTVAVRRITIGRCYISFVELHTATVS